MILTGQSVNLFPANLTSFFSQRTFSRKMSARSNVPGTRVPLSLRCVEARNKEKLEFMEDFCATKSFSEGSIFLKGSIDDVNEVRREKKRERTRGRNENSEIKSRGVREGNQFYFLRAYSSRES